MMTFRAVLKLPPGAKVSNGMLVHEDGGYVNVSLGGGVIQTKLEPGVWFLTWTVIAPPGAEYAFQISAPPEAKMAKPAKYVVGASSHSPTRRFEIQAREQRPRRELKVSFSLPLGASVAGRLTSEDGAGRDLKFVDGDASLALEHGRWWLIWQLRKGKGQRLAYRINSPRSAQTGIVEVGEMESDFEVGVIELDIS